MTPLDKPDDPPRGSRLIVPGAEPEPEEKPRIVLPPGVEAETVEDIPEYPKLRPLILVPFSDGKRELILVSDPLGVIAGQPVLGIEALPLLQLLDGSVSVNDITAALMRDNKDLRMGNVVRDFVAQLDRMLMLDTPRFETAYTEVRKAYHQLEIRPAAVEGRSYPAQREELESFLAANFKTAETWRAVDPPAPAVDRPRALLAPHLDPRRAGAAIARAYLEVDPERAGPVRFVIFGTGHTLMDDLFALTLKHFESPLGFAHGDRAFVEAVAARLGDDAYRAELAHRDEHSIEFQALYLKYRYRDRPFTIVPILCGGFHALLDAGRTPREEARFEALINAVRDAERTLGGHTVYVAGVDFSHVGPRFGDPAIDERMRKEIDERDHAAIDAARKGDADAWFESIAAHQDATRICGFAPTYAMLRCAAPGDGRLLRYEMSDEQDGSTVTVATMAWP